jgi:hypothetical protein
MKLPLRLPAVAAAVLLAVFLCVSPAQAQQGRSGSSGLSSGSGFSCGQGMGWVLGSDGVARCRMNAVTQGITATSCAANSSYTTPAGGSCVFNLPTTAGGATISVRNSNTGTHTGSLALECNASNGQWSNPVASCVELPRVSGLSVSASSVLMNTAQSVSWTSVAATSATLSCSGANPYSGSGLAANGSVSVPTGNEGSTTCSVTVTGPGGTSGASTISWNARVSAGCAATTFQPGACSYPVYARSSGENQTTSTTTAGFTGSITSLCTDGNWSYSNASCVALPPVMAPAPKQWHESLLTRSKSTCAYPSGYTSVCGTATIDQNGYVKIDYTVMTTSFYYRSTGAYSNGQSNLIFDTREFFDRYACRHGVEVRYTTINFVNRDVNGIPNDWTFTINARWLGNQCSR